MNFDSNWIQAGELGLAFVVVILCVWLVRFTLKQNAIREERLISRLEKQQDIADKQGEILQHLANYINNLEKSLNERLTTIENIIDVKLRAKERRKS